MHRVTSRLPQPLREAGLIWLITRGAVFLMAPLAYLTLPKIEPLMLDVPPKVNTALTDTFTGLPHYLIDIWAKWDAVWYLEIATHGYARGDASTAFFPLYPLLLAAFKPLFLGNGVVAGIFISVACCLVAFWLLYLLVEIDFGQRIARRTVLYLAIFPTSFFFQTIYSESLFLALTIGCIYLARRQEYILAGILGALAVLTRSAGLLLIVPLAIMYMKDRQWQWRRIRWDVVFLLLVPVGLGVWMLYQWIALGDPWLYNEAQSNWLREFLWPWQGGPLTGLWRGFEAAWKGARTVLNTPDNAFWPIVDRDPRLWATYNVLNFSFAAVFLGLCVAAFRRLPLAYASYALLVLLLPLTTPSSFVPLLSMPRFVLAAFPIFILLALWGEKNWWVDRTIMVVSLVFLGLLAAKFVVWTWVA